MHLLYGSSFVASDETTHDDVFKQHHLERGQYWVTVQHCQHTTNIQNVKRPGF